MRKLFAVAAIAALGCGGGQQGGETQEAAGAESPAQSGAQPAAAATGTVHEVKMLLTDDGNYMYEPATLTIKAGDTVRWINVSGFPHNVSFYADQIPEGAQAVLESAMPNQDLGPLGGRLMTQADETYEVSFVGAPVGDYGYFCVPHEALGMKATLAVTE